MTLGLSSRTGPFGAQLGTEVSSRPIHSTQLRVLFGPGSRWGGDGGVSDKEFLEVFVCKINRLGAREGCGRLFLLGGRVDFSWYSEIR